MVRFLLVAWSLLAAALPAGAGDRRKGVSSTPPPSRDDEPVLVSGSELPEFAGRLLADLKLYRYDEASASYRPIPFQFDEKLDWTFNPGTELEFTEKIYDVFGAEDGRLDADDELAFMFRDAGRRAPSAIPWPEGAGPVRYELVAVDTRPGVQNPERYAYLFEGAGLAESPIRYVSWDRLPTTSILTEVFELEFADRWLLTGLRIAPPCGSGGDLIDRAKGRAVPIGDLEVGEDSWNLNSVFLGGITGPVRAIRYVRGAKSGVNTIHYDLVYRNFWYRRVNLRVHPLEEFRFYFDWLPGSHTVLYTGAVRAGVPVDGVPDPGVAGTSLDWSVMNSAEGGIGVVYRLAPSPLYSRAEFHYRDDEAFDDAPAGNPDYDDEDDASWGAHGVRVLDVEGSNVTPIPIEMRLYPVCGDEGTPSFGEAIAEMADHPIDVRAGFETIDGSAVRSLRVRRDGSDVVLDWQPLDGASGYRIHVSPDPAAPHADWGTLGETPDARFVDVGAAADAEGRCYHVVPLLPDGREGLW